MSETLSQKLLPTSIEVWYVSIVSTVLLLVGSSQSVLDRFGLLDSSTVVHKNLSSALENGFLALDSFSFTPSLVTFLVWAAIGLVVFSALQSFARASGFLEFERDIGSNRYIHPSNFSRSRYWSRIISDTVLSSLAFAALAIYGFLYFLFIIPVALAYTRTFIDQASVMTFPELLLGVFTMFVGTFVLYMLIEIIIWRHHVSIH